jgi:hypothetical protein
VRADFERALTQYSDELDAALATALRTCSHELRHCSNFDYRASHDDLFALSRGDDCTYDRPTIGLAYAAWYQGRRIQHLVRALAPRALAASEDLNVVDLGGGTGATAWRSG